MTTLLDVKHMQPNWFSAENKQFFGDVSYQVLHGEKTSKPYLVRSTYAWTDMFGGKRTFHWRVNPLDETLKIGPVINDVFSTLTAVESWLEEN